MVMNKSNTHNKKPFECKGLKIAFQNVNSMNPQKLAHLVGQLNKFDIIFLSEVNSPNSIHNFCFANDNKFYSHFDPSVRRIGVITNLLVEIKTVGIGLKLEQLRTQRDKTAVQSFVYEVKIGCYTVFIENVYAVPDLSPHNTRKLVSHVDDQAKKYPYYMVGGDMNLNWKDDKNREYFLECSSLTQRVNNLTRICKYRKNNQDRTSKTIIDLIFCNNKLNQLCHTVKVKVISKLFDHKSVYAGIVGKSYNYYKDVTYFKNPYNRPVPDATQTALINEEIDKMQISEHDNYDTLIIKTRTILNDIVPCNPSGPQTKRFYRNPFSKSLLKEIKYKHHLEQKKMKTNDDRARYTAQCNKVTKLKRQEINDYRESLINKAKNPQDIQKTIKFIQNGHMSTINGNPDKVSVNGVSGSQLAEESSEFFRKRAVELVTEETMLAAGDPAPALRENEVLPEVFDFEFPVFENFNDFLPKNKVSNSAGPDGISAAVLEKCWPSFRAKLNRVLHLSGRISYPFLDNGYFQHSIPKIVGIITLLKQLRPLGILNIIPKYFFNKPFFKALRDHLTPIFFNRNNYSYRGTHQCIIATFDEVIARINRKEKVVMVKYDFSNAFGTIHHAAVLDIFRQLNLSEDALRYLEQYLQNQRSAKTVISDKTGFYFSNDKDMSRGSPQGQVGADLIFIVQQFVLKELCEVFRSMYVDDLNDVCSNPTDLQTIDLVKRNEAALVVQSHQAGFALNDDKTTYIPYNVDDSAMVDAGLKITRDGEKCEVLGFPYTATAKGFDVKPAADMIIKRLNSRAPSVHASREYFSDPEIRTRIAKSLIYFCIGELHLVLAYDTKSNKQFERIRVKVNDLLRATGLRNTTPSTELDKVFGTNLRTFAEHGIIMNGLKAVAHDPTFFDRTYSTRQRFPANTYLSKFVELWIDLPYRTRKKIFNCKNMNQVKSTLKSLRKLKYTPKIHEDFKWISYKN